MGIYLGELSTEQLNIVNNLMETPDTKIKEDNRRIDLTDRTIGEWKVLKYAGNKKWICICSCGKIKKIRGTELRNLRSLSCGHDKDIKDIIGEHFGYWEVLEKIDSKHFRCKCHCGCGGVTRVIAKYDLMHGNSKSCGRLTTRKESLVGQRFGDWEVLEQLAGGKYKCQCSCDNKTVRTIRRADLVSGKSKSCGHKTNKLIDITGKMFGDWSVIRHVGYGEWLCRCSCGTERLIRHTELLNGDTRSCGCKRNELLTKTMISKYGETAYCKVNEPRTIDQINMVKSQEALRNTILSNFSYRPTAYELEDILGLKYTRIIKLIHKYSLEDYITIYDNSSKYETEICNLLIDNGMNNIIRRDRSILHGKELDILVPSGKFAIEFNGTYWHSDIFKSKTYHQNKTIEGFKHGIHILHIFEHEWIDDTKREMLISMIKNKLNIDKEVIYAKRCSIGYIGDEECKQFLQLYHLQGWAHSDINIGIFYENKLLGVMTFGKPRFNSEYEWELIRLAWMDGVNVVGGAERLFKTFIRNHSPKSIISYCDIAKFNGKVYLKLGFSATQNDITRPNYVWVRPSDNKVLSRYQTQKHRLIEYGLGDQSMTEDDIMSEQGFLKIYDSGNMRFTWKIGE